MFEETRPCETHTIYEHLLWGTIAYKKPGTDWRHGYMCPIFYNFAHPGRPNAFLQLLNMNNFGFVESSDAKIFRGGGCHLVEVEVQEYGYCTEKLLGALDQPLVDMFLILFCSVEGNPLGEPRTTYPDAELKKTIEANLTAAKAEFPICKTDFRSMDFASLSELVLDNSTLGRLYDNLTGGTNDNITTAHCYVEVNFVYQHQYNFTFGEMSIDDKPLRVACDESEDFSKCARRNSTANDQHEHFTCCCLRHWREPQDMCRKILLEQLKPLLNENVIAKKPEEIMSELKKDPPTKCVQPEGDTKSQAGNEVNRPCARNEGCYARMHARDVPTASQQKEVEFGGCVSEYAPDAKQRDDATSDEIETRFTRICRLARNNGECFAVLGTEDVELPDDVKGPQMVCCCRGQLGSPQKCNTGHQFGMKIGDFH
ncbi:hypothetical protein AAVH_10978 [Aphelenchoides avenae]|nr:hypothetical protein AAVH_10978 [Aphelenchus avenae]